MINWLIRAAISVPLLCGLAYWLRVTLIEPYSVSNLDFDVQFEEIHSGKGDREI